MELVKLAEHSGRPRDYHDNPDEYRKDTGDKAHERIGDSIAYKHHIVCEAAQQVAGVVVLKETER